MPPRKRKRNRRFHKPIKNQHDDRWVINLSRHNLNQDELSILNKGLNFVPTPLPIPISDQLRDIYLFNRRLKLKYFFRNSEPKSTFNPFKRTTGWTPLIGNEPALDTYVKLLENATLNHKTKKIQHNITKEESVALSNLKNNIDIIIKPADKGGAVVILNREDYLKEAFRQLSDPDTYKKLPNDPTNKTNAEITQLLKHWEKNNFIDSETINGLINRHPVTPNLYLLPKIHKKNIPGRPIIAACQSPTERISAFVDFHLKDLAKIQPSYLRDTKDFLNKLNKLKATTESIIVTADVTSLYTNIPHREGIRACKRFLTQRENKSTPTNILLHMIHLILSKNNFEFYGQNYLQINGTAMGTKMAPNYANLFMADLEERLITESPDNLKPTIWWRYIDDIFFIWDHGQDSLKSFMIHMNNFHHSIKFTFDVSTTEGVFLDTQIFKKDNKICTKVYHKPTDAYMYLHYTSCHPRHVKNNIPFGQYSRIRRICTFTEDFETQSKELTKRLLARGYPHKLLRESFNKAALLTRDELLEEKNATDSNNQVILTTTYNPPNNHLYHYIHRYRFTLDTSPHKDFYSDLRFITAYKKGPSVRNKLIKSRLSPVIHQLHSGCQPCNRPCATCPLMSTSRTITSTTNKKKHQIRQSFNCNSRNAVYVITCTKCLQQYVGQTTTTVNQRIRNHISDINTSKTDKPVAAHFTNQTCDVTNVNVTVIDSQLSNDVNTLLRLEESWIRILVTVHPSGMNIIQ